MLLDRPFTLMVVWRWSDLLKLFFLASGNLKKSMLGNKRFCSFTLTHKPL